MKIHIKKNRANGGTGFAYCGFRSRPSNQVQETNWKKATCQKCKALKQYRLNRTRKNLVRALFNENNPIQNIG